MKIKIKPTFHSILFILLIFVFPSLSYAQLNDIIKDPKAILSEINAEGAEKVVLTLYNNFDAWYFVMQNIATGEQAWLQVAIALQPGAQGGAYDELRARLGEALEHNPENVLKIAAHKYGVPFICGSPDINDNRYDSYELALQAIIKRQEKVRGITNPAFKELCESCIKRLESSKSGIARFYGVKRK